MPIAPVNPLIVYVIDSDASVRASLARVLRSAGLEPKPFESPRAFFAAVDRASPACLLMDIDMSPGGTQKLQARLKKNGSDVPLIALSSQDEDKTRDLAREMGAKFFLRKPVDDQALLDAIAWVTGEARDERALVIPPQEAGSGSA